MKVLFQVLFVVILGSIAGCGNSTSNDQGVSFLLTGFYESSEGDVGVTGYSIPLTDLTNSEASGSGLAGAVVSYVGLRNNMLGQFVRVQRLYISYVVDGSDLQPPSTTSPLSVVLTPTGPNDSSLPGNLTGLEQDDGLGSIAFSGFPLITPSLRAWFALNRNSLPEAPITVEVSVYASGITSAGKTLDTNVGTIFLYLTPDIVIPPTSGDDASSDASTTSNAQTDTSDISTIDESEL